MLLRLLSSIDNLLSRFKQTRKQFEITFMKTYGQVNGNQKGFLVPFIQLNHYFNGLSSTLGNPHEHVWICIIIYCRMYVANDDGNCILQLAAILGQLLLLVITTVTIV